jgi:hypothetical protein
MTEKPVFAWIICFIDIVLKIGHLLNDLGNNLNFNNSNHLDLFCKDGSTLFYKLKKVN